MDLVMKFLFFGESSGISFWVSLVWPIGFFLICDLSIWIPLFRFSVLFYCLFYFVLLAVLCEYPYCLRRD
ncbi:BTE_collapsed_G0004430.mRNA.1.CDS.1 [Saccharomyces cerevisiae]|nr:BTE_collapsed_G0004430.mRNA.1.CDS.1 [Saccharomyces cerevisiae]